MERVAESAKAHEPVAANAGRGRDASLSASLPPALELQQLAGNQAMQYLLRSGYVHAKLAISSPDDPEEREADHVASTIMRKMASVPCSCSEDEGMCEECQQKQCTPSIQRRATAPSAPAHIPRIVSDVLRSSGHPLDSVTRAFFEPRFGRDFSDVRIHSGSDAAASARSINAHAYTAGSDIVFASGQYSPDTTSGRSLLAHELTHVAQRANHIDTLRRMPSWNFGLSPWGEDSEEPSAESLYDHSFAPSFMLGVDKCAEHMAGHLLKHVTTHSDPYPYIQAAFKETPDYYEDNVGAAFVSMLSEVQLSQFAKTEAGKATLDMLHEAMITGNVSGFERYQAARIEQFGVADALKRQALPDFLYLDGASPEMLVKQFEVRVIASDLDTAADMLARQLRKDLERRPDPYSFLRQVFEQLSSSDEDNVAAAFVAMIDNALLGQIANSDQGRAVLDVLYEAMITGSVSDFERYEADRILKAKNMRTSLKDFQDYQQHRRIFPVKYQKFFRDCYAPISAELLSDGQIRVKYSTVRIYECSEFRKDVATLGVPDLQLVDSGVILKTDELVSVRLYDQDEQVLDVPAIALLDYANESTNKTLSLAGEAFFAGLTLPLGGLPEAGIARFVAIADRVAWGISTVSALIKDNQEWIAKLPYGKEFLEAVDSVNSLAAYYGWTRLGVDGLRFASSTLRPQWQSWHAELNELSSAHPEAQAIDHQLESTLKDLEEAQAAASAPGQETPGAPQEQPAPQPEREAGERAQGEPAGSAKGEQEKLLADAGKQEDGRLLKPKELEAELDIVRNSKPQPSREPGYIDEVSIGNGHTWRRAEDGTWCRFTKMTLCGTEIPGVPAATEALAIDVEKVVNQLQSRAMAQQAGIPELIYGDATVMTRTDFPGILPEDPVAIGRAAPPAINPGGREVGLSEVQNLELRYDFVLAKGAGAKNIRVNQTMVVEDLRAGTNRPDLYFELNGYRIHVEYDRFPMTRALDHAKRILTNDPEAIVILKGVDY